MTKFCLTAIVRDEEKVIRRCLRSVKPFISCWAIADTGSKDRTREIIREELAGIPGVLREDGWVDFETNRNLALEEAKPLAKRYGARYILTIDADEEVQFPDDAEFSKLTEPGYAAVFSRPNMDERWYRQLLVRADLPWRWEGVVHETLVCPGTISQILRDVTVTSRFDGRRELSGDKYRRDVKALKKHLRKHPDDARAQFYLARTYIGLQKPDQAIRAFRRRIEMDPDLTSEEGFYSLYQIASMRDMRGDHWLDVARAYQEAWMVRPWRAEPLWALAALHTDHGELPMAEMYARRAALLPIPPDTVFVQLGIYEWRAADELAGILCKLGKLEEARSILEKLLKRPQIPKAERPRMEKNLEEIRKLEAA